MKIRIGEAESISAPENFKIIPDDRQTLIATDSGNVVQDYGHIACGDKITFSAIFYKEDFYKLWQYFNERSHIVFVDQGGITWPDMRVRILSYGYKDRFEKVINCELELWRI